MNMKMKTLALAVLGFAGFAAAGVAMAQTCPTDPAQPNGPWSSKTVATDATLAITTPGLGVPQTNCKLTVSINSGALANTRSFVSDTSPVDEPRYRARFYFDVSALSGLTLGNQQVKLFDAFANTSPAGVGTDEVIIRLIGGPAVRIQVADSTQPSNFKVLNIPLPASANSNYRVEFDMVQGAAGSFRCWVTDAATVTNDSTTTPSPQCDAITVNNSGWSGVTQANLGIFSTSAGYRLDPPNGVAGQPLSVDEFDSRRSTFIGQ